MLFCDIDIMDANLDHKKGMYVGVEGATITYVGDCEPQDAAKYGDRYDGRGKLLMSAFYNTHAHTPMTLLRGYAENQPLQQWLNQTVWPFEGKMHPGHYAVGAKLSMAEMLRYGVVGYTDMYFGGIENCKAAIEAGMKLNHADGGTMFMDDYTKCPSYATNNELFADYAGAADGRIKIDLCIHAEYTTPEGMIRGIVEEAAKRDANIHLHMSETKTEHEECIGRHGMTPAAWFDSLGVFEHPTTAAHCVWVSDDDIALMAAKGVTASLNPASNGKLASGFAPAAKLVAGGVNCTIGTDGMASNNTHNILQSAYLLAVSQKGYDLDPTVLTPKEILQMMTVNGAKSQGRTDCGVLAQGKRADLVVMDIDKPWMRPVHDMATNIVYSANGADVVMTMCDGKVLYKDGQWTTIDVERAASDVDAAVDEILTALAADAEAKN